MLIDDFNQIIEDKVDEIQQNVKLDLRKDIDKNMYYHSNLFLKLMNFKNRTLYGKSYYVVCSKELKGKLSKIPMSMLEISIRFLKLSPVKVI